MSMTYSSSGEAIFSARQQILTRVEREHRTRISWSRVIKLPGAVLLLMVLAGLAIAGNTRRLEIDSERLIADTAQFAMDASQQRPSAHTTGPTR